VEHKLKVPMQERSRASPFATVAIPVFADPSFVNFGCQEKMTVGCTIKELPGSNPGILTTASNT
jgi:hypothetical protein